MKDEIYEIKDESINMYDVGGFFIWHA